MNLTDQNSMEFFEKAREYRERINLLISRSEFRKYYDGCEILGKWSDVGQSHLLQILYF